MSQQAAFFGFLLYILWLFATDIRRRVGVSSALWNVVLWSVLIGSRPVSTWFNVGGEVGSQAEAYDEGNPLERMVYFFLIFSGLFTLLRRRVYMGSVIRANKWLFLFFLYWAMSVAWADLPFLAFKRWIKDIGNIVMVLVILTENNPIEAVKVVFVRCAYLLIPLSVLFIKFYPELGRAYHIWSGEMMYTGVATHKNSLGTLVLVCGLFSMWDFFDRFRNKSKPRSWIGVANDVSLMIMALWLLLKANSSTALGCAVIGAVSFLGLGLPAIKKKIRHLEFYLIITGLVVWLLNLEFDITRIVVVDILGRDLTLTTRTEVWPMLLAKNESVLFGSGFNSFWSGEKLAVIYKEFGIIQAHNGYLETYLNGGLLAILLLIALLFSAGRTIKSELVQGSDYARVRFMFLLIAIIYNFTEAAFNKMGLIWFATLLVIIQVGWLASSSRLDILASKSRDATRRRR